MPSRLMRSDPASLRALEDPAGPALLRDLRRLRRLAAIGFLYWTRGARLRRAYRRAQERGGTLWLDEWFGPVDDPTERGR